MATIRAGIIRAGSVPIGRKRPAILRPCPRVTWVSELRDHIPHFQGPAALADPATFGERLTAIHAHGIGEGLAAEPLVIDRVPAMIGPVRATNFKRVFEVQ